MLERIGALVRKEVRQLVRDPILLILVGWLYTVEVVLCAYALSFDLREAPIAIVDNDNTPLSREVADRLDVSRNFRVAARSISFAETRNLLEREDVLAILRFPAGWTRDLHGRPESELQLVIDGSNAAVASTVRGYALGMLARYIEEARGHRDNLGAARPPVEIRSRVLYNAELKFVYFVFLSMVALAALIVGIVHMAASIVKEKESGTMEQLLVSPVRLWELLVAKMAPILAVGLIGLTLSLGLSLWFEIPMRGSIPLFYTVSAVFLLSSTGIGVLIATLSKNLQQALLISFFGMIPIMFLSGTMVPIENMPPPVQAATLASPLRYYMESLLGIFLKGSDWQVLWPEIITMIALTAMILAASAVFFRRRMS